MKNWQLALILIAVTGCVTIGCNSGTATAENQSGTLGAEDPAFLNLDSVTLTIELQAFGRDNITETVKDVAGPMTVSDLLQRVAKESGLQLDFSGRGETVFVKSIAGIRGGTEGRGWWLFKVNDKLANRSAGVTKLKNGDKVVWWLGDYPSNNSTRNNPDETDIGKSKPNTNNK